jgi:protocatechuate 3,4-dioxygenase beta subunit
MIASRSAARSTWPRVGAVLHQEKTSVTRRTSHLVLLIAFAVACSLPAAAQNKKADADLRTIHGSVLDKDENPVPSGVVYLLNVKSQAVRTYIADEMGAYRFSGLDPNVDYEIHAEHNELTSSTRTVSSFDSRRDIEITLKLAHQKPAH